MSSNKMVTKSDLQEMYSRILPYLGGSADAGFTPVGTIISMMSNHAPANYLACDGTTYNIADYPELANHFLNEFGSKNKFGGNGTTTFAVPDLRGEFLRGTGTNSHNNSYIGAKEGSGSDVGVHQPATVEQSLNQYDGKLYFGKDTSLTISTPAFMDSQSKSNTYQYLSNGTSGTQADRTLIHTARPTNTSVLYCIATKNIYLNPQNDYSTDEKVIGTWIDGRTLFQRTFAIPSTSLVADQVQNITIAENLNIDEIVSFDGMVKSGGSATNFVSFNYNNQYWYRPLLYSQTLRLDAVSHVATTIYGYLTIKYVKSTS